MIIETERLFLKPVTPLDIDLYRVIMTSPNMTKYLPKGLPYTEHEIREHVNKRVTHWSCGFGSYIVYLKQDVNKKLGYVGVEVSPNPECNDIRYGFIQEFQGKGYALEAAKALVKQTFQLGKHNRLYGVAVKENTSSIKIMLKLGMVEDKSVLIYDDQSLITMSIKNV